MNTRRLMTRLAAEGHTCATARAQLPVETTQTVLLAAPGSVTLASASAAIVRFCRADLVHAE